MRSNAEGQQWWWIPVTVLGYLKFNYRKQVVTVSVQKKYNFKNRKLKKKWKRKKKKVFLKLCLKEFGSRRYLLWDWFLWVRVKEEGVFGWTRGRVWNWRLHGCYIHTLLLLLLLPLHCMIEYWWLPRVLGWASWETLPDKDLSQGTQIPFHSNYHYTPHRLSFSFSNPHTTHTFHLSQLFAKCCHAFFKL